MKFLCNKRLQRRLPDPFPLLWNGVWARETKQQLAHGVRVCYNRHTLLFFFGGESGFESIATPKPATGTLHFMVLYCGLKINVLPYCVCACVCVCVYVCVCVCVNREMRSLIDCTCVYIMQVAVWSLVVPGQQMPFQHMWRLISRLLLLNLDLIILPCASVT